MARSLGSAATLELRAPGRTVSRVAAVAITVIAVALSAQASVPLPFSPVPMSLQPLAVILAGGLLGPGLGALALGCYLAAGIAGLPVFAPTVPLQGIGRLLGPTGGYLLAFPLAAAVTGRLVRSAPTAGTLTFPLRALAASLAGMAIIHLGGAAQLALLGGDPARALQIGVIPFLLADGVKVLLAVATLVAVRHARRSGV